MMYCRNCGKEIENDSIFCKYCGKNIGVEKPDSQNLGFLNKFRSLSQKKQVTIILYCIWVLIWLCVLLGNAGHRDFAAEYVLPFFVFTIVIPFAIVGIWYIFKLKFQKKASVNNSIESHQQESSETKTHKTSPMISQELITEDSNEVPRIVSPIISSEPLLSFARNNGKMQVVNRKLEDNKVEHYCLFTSSEGIVIRVEFSERIGFLSSNDISSKKYILAVNKCANGTYYLDYIDNTQIEDSLQY